LLATAGLEDQLVVETSDAVLVASRERAQEVKELVDQLKASGRPEPITHKRVYRPWGAYEGIASADRYQVKHIVIKPGGQLSLQLHHHRAEHWVIVKGTARVEHDGESFLLSEDQSTYIPIGTKHRISNPGTIPLELIEVQTGSYLGEDDIVRFEDSYGRS
jgi:mannose-1-phosphate guanylyltransferase/mannose-6-phosphate isomerase